MICKECDRDLDASSFYKQVKHRCADCHKRAMKRNRLTNPRVQEYDRARAKEPLRLAKSRENARLWRKKHPEAYRAQNAVNNALRDGKLTRSPCAMCGSVDHVHAHHKDYTRPLDVIWLCARCHHRLHASFPELGGHFAEGAL